MLEPLRRIAVSVFGLVLSACIPQQQTELVGQVTVIDGDSIHLHGTNIRLAGIDAPELSQLCYRDGGQPWPCGREAATALRELVADEVVKCFGQHRDRYKRLLAYCTVRGLDIGGLQVERGYAVAYLQYEETYRESQVAAKAAQHGIWARL